MIYFVMDVQLNEPDFLNRLKMDRLLVLSLEGQVIAELSAPSDGWTNEALAAQARLLEPKTMDGAEAFLGSCWVGGTEV